MPICPCPFHVEELDLIVLNSVITYDINEFDYFEYYFQSNSRILINFVGV